MIHTHSPTGFSGLLRPLPDEEILVPGETVWYRQPKHWTAIVEPTAETASVLLLLALVWVGPPGALNILLVVMIIAALVVIVRAIIIRRWNWSTVLIGATVVVVLANASLGPAAFTFLVAVVMIARLLLRLTRWAFYEERFVTDRRVIETSGLFGSRVSSMPLTRVTDINLNRSPVAEILGYGELRIESAGQDQALGRIRYLRRPERFHETIVSLSTTPMP